MTASEFLSTDSGRLMEAGQPQPSHRQLLRMAGLLTSQNGCSRPPVLHHWTGRGPISQSDLYQVRLPALLVLVESCRICFSPQEINTLSGQHYLFPHPQNSYRDAVRTALNLVRTEPFFNLFWSLTSEKKVLNYFPCSRQKSALSSMSLLFSYTMIPTTMRPFALPNELMTWTNLVHLKIGLKMWTW